MKRTKATLGVLFILLIGLNVAAQTSEEARHIETEDVERTVAVETLQVETLLQETNEDLYIDIQEIVAEPVEEPLFDDAYYVPLEEFLESQELPNVPEEVYIPIEELHGENQTENLSLEEPTNDTEEIELEEESQEEILIEESSEELILEKRFKNGRVEIEYQDYETSDIEIEKKEIIESDDEKIVQISSDEHFEHELRVYTDLPRPARPEDVRIEWLNEDEDVTRQSEFVDEDGDGFAEGLWIVVPHLSTQSYRITILTEQGGSLEQAIGLVALRPLNGAIVTNPVEFEFEIDYVNQTEPSFMCNLEIPGVQSYNFTGGTVSFQGGLVEFEEGNYTWIATCQDTANGLVNTTGGSFMVEHTFELALNQTSTVVGHAIRAEITTDHGPTELRVIDPSNTPIFVTNISEAGFHTIEVPGNLITESGAYVVQATAYHYEVPEVLVETLQVIEAEVTFPSTLLENEVATYTVTIDTPITLDYELYVGSQKLDARYGFIGGTRQATKTMDATGTFAVRLNLTIEGRGYIIDFGNIVVTQQTTTTSGDTEDPEVKLLFPDWEEVVEDDEITFEYRVTDNKDIANCSLKLFNATKSSSNVYTKDTLIFPLRTSDKTLAFNNSMKNDSIAKVQLVDFDEGNYIWEVTCYDTAGNEGKDFNYFEVEFEETLTATNYNTTQGDSYERQEEVEEMMDAIDSFLEKEQTYGIKEKEALRALGITTDMDFYKKQLVQLNQDFRYNLRFVTEDKKESRIAEMNKQLDEIKEKIITGIEVKGNYEFSKNSLDTPLADIISNYLSVTDTTMQRSALKALIRANEDIQKNLQTKVKSQKVRLDYLDETKDIILVQKQFNLREDTIQTLFEVLPEEIRTSAIFVAGGKSLGGGIYEFNIEDLEDGEIVYYFEEDFELTEIEKTESVLFSESISEKSLAITGMVSSIGDSMNPYSLFFIFLVAGMGYVGLVVIGKVRLESWKKNPNTAIIIDLTSQTKQLIRANDLEKAHVTYAKMKEIYKTLPVKHKEFFYKEIKKVALAINKKDILNLVKEYELAKIQNRKEDMIALHKRISELYKVLPKRYQEKIYQRLVKKEV